MLHYLHIVNRFRYLPLPSLRKLSQYVPTKHSPPHNTTQPNPNQIQSPRKTDERLRKFLCSICTSPDRRCAARTQKSVSSIEAHLSLVTQFFCRRFQEKRGNQRCVVRSRRRFASCFCVICVHMNNVCTAREKHHPVTKYFKRKEKIRLRGTARII